MRIYTRTGDNGFTSIHGRIRVPKTDIRIEANGTLDELNVVVGTIRTYLSETHPFQSLLYGIQVNLMSVMSLVATKSEMRGDNPNQLDDIVTPIDCRRQGFDSLRPLRQRNSFYITLRFFRNAVICYSYQ